MERESRPRFETRGVAPQDATEITFLHAQSFFADFPWEYFGVTDEGRGKIFEYWLSPETITTNMQSIEEYQNDPGSMYEVAQRNGLIVGFIRGITESDESKKLTGLYVRPDLFGAGVGPQLMESALEWAGNQTVKLDVAEYSERAIRFYEKYGFEKVEGSNFLALDKIPQFQMVREVSDEI